MQPETISKVEGWKDLPPGPDYLGIDKNWAVEWKATLKKELVLIYYTSNKWMMSVSRTSQLGGILYCDRLWPQSWNRHMVWVLNADV